MLCNCAALCPQLKRCICVPGLAAWNANHAARLHRGPGHLQASDPRQASHLAVRGVSSGKPSQAFCHLGASPEVSNGCQIEPSCQRVWQGWWCERRSSPLPRPAREPSSGPLATGRGRYCRALPSHACRPDKTLHRGTELNVSIAVMSCVREIQLKKDQLQLLLGCRRSGHSKCSNPRI